MYLFRTIKGDEEQLADKLSQQKRKLHNIRPSEKDHGESMTHLKVRRLMDNALSCYEKRCSSVYGYFSSHALEVMYAQV